MVQKLVLPPDQSGYAVTDGEEVLRQQLDGGRGRYRRDIINSSSMVNVQWSVGPENYQYLRSFYKVLSRTSEPFKIDLYVDSPVLTEHDANFVPNTMRLLSQSGLTFVVGCQLEIMPIDTEEFDNSLLELVGIYGSPEQVQLILNGLEKLVNVDLPGIA